MTYLEALEVLASNAHVWRFRELCHEANPNTTQRDAYRGLVIRMASGEPLNKKTGRPAVPEAVALTRQMKACIYRSVFPPCGCAGGRCGLRWGAIVSHLDCFACLREYDPITTTPRASITIADGSGADTTSP